MADLYGTLAGALTYHADRGNAAWAASSDPLRTAALVRASQYIDGTYLALFQGFKVDGRDQVLQWPRTGAMDMAGYAVPSSAVPVEIINATYEAALRELVSPGSLNPDIAVGGGVIKRVKAGSVEVEYSATAATQATFLRIEDILAPLLGRQSAYFGSAARG
jgi:hypothetical protein